MFFIKVSFFPNREDGTEKDGSSQVKVYFYSTFKQQTKVLYNKYNTTKTVYKKKKSKPSWQQSLKRALFKSQGEQIRFIWISE